MAVWYGRYISLAFKMPSPFLKWLQHCRFSHRLYASRLLQILTYACDGQSFLIWDILKGVLCYFVEVLICTFVMNIDVAHLFMHLFASYIISLVNFLLKYFAIRDIFLVTQFWEFFKYSEHSSFFRYIICKHFLLIHLTASSEDQKFLNFAEGQSIILFL